MYFKEEIQADNVLFIPRAEQVNAVWNVQRIQAVREVKKDDFVQEEDTFAKVFEQEQKKHERREEKTSQATETAPQTLYESGMNYYNKHAMTAYFYMTYSTADFKG